MREWIKTTEASEIIGLKHLLFSYPHHSKIKQTFFLGCKHFTTLVIDTYNLAQIILLLRKFFDQLTQQIINFSGTYAANYFY